jgi:NAD(P)-dependent dehydrogenase (short-subunit alcohol dehydrogenase family)
VPKDNRDQLSGIRAVGHKADQKIRIFNGATAVVTGGASGIGQALAEELANRGSEVVLVDLQLALARKVAALIRNRGGRAIAFKADVADFNEVRQLIQETVIRTGRIDYIFNNAGVNFVGSVEHYSSENWRQMMETNLLGVINGVQAVYEIMINQGFGHIINTASMAGLIPFPGLVAYTTAKHAVVGLSRSLRIEAALRGIRVSVICPGFVRTAILENGGIYGKKLYDPSPEQEQLIQEMIKTCKPLSPDLVARKVLDKVAQNKAIIFLPAWYRWIWRINRLFPAMGMVFLKKRYEKIQKLQDGKQK